VGGRTLSDWNYDQSAMAVTLHIKDARQDWTATVRY
jgi:hypothetical protein